jgi:flagellar hook-associated protein 2
VTIPPLGTLRAPNLTYFSMAGLQLSGLASGFDWKTLVDNLISLERTPVVRLEAERALNDRKVSAFEGLKTRLLDLKTAAAGLRTDGLFTGRTVTPTNASTTWSASAASGAPAGSYAINVLQLATASRRTGASDIGAPLAPTADVSGLTIASLPTASAVTAGSFTVNGKAVTVALTDSLQDVLGRISTATEGAVAGSYDPGTDTISLTSTSEIVLGAANDTSNFLGVMKLRNNGSGSIASTSGLGVPNLNVPLASSRLRTAITEVDGSGNGSFTVNGVSIAYNVNTDSLSAVLGRINAAGAGVTASYDSAAERVVLTNNTTGDIGLFAEETGTGFLAAAGLTGPGSALNRGVNARYTVNGGSELTSATNALDESSHGLAGLSITARTTGSETFTVAANTTAMRAQIDAFVAKYNAVQTYIEDQTKITSSNGKVSAALLSGNREIQSWATTLRTTAFGALSGLTGTVKRLEDLGIDFASGTSSLSVKNPTKLDTALRDRATDVQAFFGSISTGFANRLESFVTSTTGETGSGGMLATQTSTLTRSSKSITEQIANIERQLEQRRRQLEAGFIAMEEAQSRIQQMQQQLTNAFATTTTKK